MKPKLLLSACGMIAFLLFLNIGRSQSNLPPSISVQPQSVTVTNGATTTFSVAATGTPPLSYQWQFYGTNLPYLTAGTGNATTNANLVIVKITSPSVGPYDVVITNAWGSITSSIATLNLAYPPAITSQPIGQYLAAGSHASFSVGATGTAPLAYQWQCNGTNLTDGGQFSGSTTTNLLVTQLTTNNAGFYSVIITNAWGAATSVRAELNVGTPPVITTQPVNEGVPLGRNTSFSVGVTGLEPYRFQWQHAGTNLIQSQGIIDVNAAMLTLEGVTNTSAGLYDVIISNTWGSVTSSVVVLTVLYPPAITSQPVSQTLTNGGPAGFSVGATGAGPLTYQWVYNVKTLLPTATISTVAGTNGNINPQTGVGDGGLAINAGLDRPYGVATDNEGNLFIADSFDGRIRKVTTNGLITTVAGTGSNGFNGNGNAATNSWLDEPYGVAADAYGGLFVADTLNQRIRTVLYGVVVTVAGTGQSSYSGDGGPAYNATLERPEGVAVDAAGNIYIADTYNARVRRVDINDTITTVAGKGLAGYAGDGGAATNAELNQPAGVAVDASGNLFIADSFNQRIRKVDTNGIITTVAGKGVSGYSGDGGPATNAWVYEPAGVAVDANGNLYIADTGNQRVRLVTMNANLSNSNIITTVAGHGIAGYAGDGGAATNAWLDQPSGVTVDSFGNLFIADTFNSRIRKVTPQGPSLVFTNAVSTNAGTYQVIVSNAGGSVTSSVVTLTVDLTPTIFNQPVSRTILNGGAVNFSVSATGTAPVSYQWQFNGVNLPQQTNISLFLAAVSPANAGSYQVVITNSFGSVTSSVATLVVEITPSVTSETSSNGTFTLNLQTTPNLGSRVLAATNLNPPVAWLPIYTNVPGTNGVWQFKDTNASQYPFRFYRITTP